MFRASDIHNALDHYHENAELPEGYAVRFSLDSNNGPSFALFNKQQKFVAYLHHTGETITDAYNSVVYRNGFWNIKAVAWQHALNNDLDEALAGFPKISSVTVESATGNTRIELYKLPLPSAPKFVAAEITITRGPIILKSHARDVSLGQIVAAICG